MSRTVPLPRMLMLVVLAVAALGLSGLGADLAQAIPMLTGDPCADACADVDAPCCDSVCLCACCPSPAVTPSFGSNPGLDREANLDAGAELAYVTPTLAAPFHPPR